MVTAAMRAGIRLNRVAAGPVVSDTFTRADNSTSLGSAETGQAWNALVGTWGVISGTAYTSVATAQSIAVIDTASTNADAQATVGGGNQGLVVGLVDASNYYTSDSGIIYRCVAGAFTNIGGGALTLAAGNVMRLVRAGNQISLYRNGTLLASVTDSSLTTGTKHGLRIHNSATVRLDNFTVA